MYFVGVRGTIEESQLGNPSSSSNSNNNNNMNSNSSSSSSNGLLIGAIVGGLLAAIAVLMLAFVAYRRSGHCKGATETNDNDDDYEGDLNSHVEGTNKNNNRDEEVIGEMNMMHSRPPPSMIVVSPILDYRCSIFDNEKFKGVPSYSADTGAYRQEKEQQRQRQQHQWLSQSMTSETDMTPVVSNAGRSQRQQQKQQRWHVAGSHLTEQTIQECDGDDDEESEW